MSIKDILVHVECLPRQRSTRPTGGPTRAPVRRLSDRPVDPALARLVDGAARERHRRDCGGKLAG
jgi:hypothetical protein